MKKSIKRPLVVVASIVYITSCSTKQPGKNISYEKKDTVTVIKEFKFEKPQGISFQVSNVKTADTLINADDARKVVENKIGKNILWLPEEHSPNKVVSSYNNGFIQTIQECYDNHRPLILTPDNIWLAICQGVSIHVNENYNTLEDIIFNDNKPTQLIIRNDSLEYSSKHWGDFLNSLSNETRKYTKADFYSFFVSEFTSTSSIEKTAYQVTLLEAYKKGFEYVAETGCGIPSITIAGKKKSLLLKNLFQLSMERLIKNSGKISIKVLKITTNSTFRAGL